MPIPVMFWKNLLTRPDSTRPDPTRPDSTDFQHLLARTDSTRGFLKYLSQPRPAGRVMKVWKPLKEKGGLGATTTTIEAGVRQSVRYGTVRYGTVRCGTERYAFCVPQSITFITLPKIDVPSTIRRSVARLPFPPCLPPPSAGTVGLAGDTWQKKVNNEEHEQGGGGPS